MLKAQLVLPTCTAGTTQLLQNLHLGFEQEGNRFPFLVLNISSFPGLVAGLHRDFIWGIFVFWEQRFPPEFVAATGVLIEPFSLSLP